MIVNSCFSCTFHQIMREEREMMSFCQKEDCWAEFSECEMRKAFNRSLIQELSLLFPPFKSQSPT